MVLSASASAASWPRRLRPGLPGWPAVCAAASAATCCGGSVPFTGVGAATGAAFLPAFTGLPPLAATGAGAGMGFSGGTTLGAGAAALATGLGEDLAAAGAGFTGLAATFTGGLTGFAAALAAGLAGLRATGFCGLRFNAMRSPGICWGRLREPAILKDCGPRGNLTCETKMPSGGFLDMGQKCRRTSLSAARLLQEVQQAFAASLVQPTLLLLGQKGIQLGRVGTLGQFLQGSAQLVPGRCCIRNDGLFGGQPVQPLGGRMVPPALQQLPSTAGRVHVQAVEQLAQDVHAGFIEAGQR